MKLSDFTLEQYLLGELPGERMREIESILAGDTVEAERLEALRRSNDEILDTYRPEHIAGVIKSRYSLEKRPEARPEKGNLYVLKKALAPLLATAMMVAAVILVPGIINRQDSLTGPDITRVKGKPGISVFRKQDGRPELLHDRSGVSAGDLLQISFMSPEDPYVLVFSIDGNGTVTLHYPEADGLVEQTKPGSVVLIPRSYELDDAPGFERFFMVTSSYPFTTGMVLSGARSFARRKNIMDDNFSVPGDYSYYSIILLKE